MLWLGHVSLKQTSVICVVMGVMMLRSVVGSVVGSVDVLFGLLMMITVSVIGFVVVFSIGCWRLFGMSVLLLLVVLVLRENVVVKTVVVHHNHRCIHGSPSHGWSKRVCS